MSSYDTDDTTPLINPVTNNANHGTFPGSAAASNDDDDPIVIQGLSDDEILDGSTQNQNSQRFNPFDRVPNLPPQLAHELLITAIETNPTRWQRFKK